MASNPRNLSSKAVERVLQALSDGHGGSFSEIAEWSGLSPSTVTRAVGALAAAGKVEVIQERGAPGRPRSFVRSVMVEEYVAGVAILGRAVRLQKNEAWTVEYGLSGVVVDRAGKVVRRSTKDWRSLPATSTSVGPDPSVAAVVDDVRVLVGELRDGVVPLPIRALGVDLGGQVDARAGLVRYSPAFGWHDVPLQALLADATGMSVVIDNDATSLARYEASQRPSANFIVVLAGEGIGSAAVVDGQVLLGAHRSAGEIGHISAGGDNVKLCRCERIGCIETVAGYDAIRGIARDSTEIPEGDDHVHRVVALAKEGNLAAQTILSQAADALAVGVSAAAIAVDPDLILVSSTAFRASGVFRSALEKQVRAALPRGIDVDFKWITTDHAHAAAGAALATRWAAIAEGLLSTAGA